MEKTVRSKAFQSIAGRSKQMNLNSPGKKKGVAGVIFIPMDCSLNWLNTVWREFKTKLIYYSFFAACANRITIVRLN